MPNWPSDLALSDELSLIRAGLPLTREDPADCPAYLAVKARPWLISANRLTSYEPLVTFTLKPLMAALDRVELEGRPPEDTLTELLRTRGAFGNGRRSHDGLVRWTVEAFTRYLRRREAWQRDHGEETTPTLPVADEWVVRNPLPQQDARGARVYERTAWGRRYASADGSVRELWLLSFGAAKKDRPQAERAAAAFVTAFGEPCRSGYDREHARPEPYTAIIPYESMPKPDRVRIVDFGCGDGKAVMTADCTPLEAGLVYDRATAPVLTRVMDGAERRPGRSCVECPGAGRCPALAPTDGGTRRAGRTPSEEQADQAERPDAHSGLIRLPGPSLVRKRRSLSASDLRAYTECPAKYHLTRELKLRSDRPETEAIRRGRAVDTLLNTRHAQRLPRGCRGLPPPESATWDDLAEDTARTAEAMVERHAALCPLDRLDLTEEVRVQPQVTAYDPVLDLVLIAQPDLLHTRRGGWVWRETKTLGSSPYEGRSVLRTYPQLALAVLLMRTGELAQGSPRRSRIELELLRVEAGNRVEIDPWQPEVHTEAQGIIREMAEPWLRDTVYQATAGRQCHGCEALDWCREGREHVTEVPGPGDATAPDPR